MKYIQYKESTAENNFLELYLDDINSGKVSSNNYAHENDLIFSIQGAARLISCVLKVGTILLLCAYGISW